MNTIDVDNTSLVINLNEIVAVYVGSSGSGDLVFDWDGFEGVVCGA